MALSDNTDDPASAAPHSSSSSSSRSNNTNKITTWRENSSKQKVEDHATKYHLQSSMPKDFITKDASSSNRRPHQQKCITIKTKHRIRIPAIFFNGSCHILNN